MQLHWAASRSKHCATCGSMSLAGAEARTSYRRCKCGAHTGFRCRLYSCAGIAGTSRTLPSTHGRLGKLRARTLAALKPLDKQHIDLQARRRLARGRVRGPTRRFVTGANRQCQQAELAPTSKLGARTASPRLSYAARALSKQGYDERPPAVAGPSLPSTLLAPREGGAVSNNLRLDRSE